EDGLTRTAEAAGEPLLQVAREGRRRHAVEERVADPVGVHDTQVERVLDSILVRDQLEVRPRALERRREVGETAVREPFVPVLEERPRLVSATQTEPVRRIRVAREEQRARCVRHAISSRGRTASAATRTTPAVTSAVAKPDTAVPSATPDKSAVITAPNTSTAVTSTACARASAAYQVAT